MEGFYEAQEIIKKLTLCGHVAYFAGGWVRDYLMGHPSDDIDIATSASPEQILDLFPGTNLVGLRFGVIIVPIGAHQFEIATFRKDIEYKNGRNPEKIIMSTPQEDALRRDFTINGMFYDPLEEKIYDYVGGIDDIKRQIIRAIGNPHERFFEDRLRMIRAFRFAARFGFMIDQDTQEAIRENAPLLFPAVAMERIWQELSKMQAFKGFGRALIEMHRLKLLEVIFPDLKNIHLKDLEKRVVHFPFFPKDLSNAYFLLDLFPGYSIEKMEEIAAYLKIPNRDLDRLIFYIKNFPMKANLSRYQTALFYAHPFASDSLQVYAAHLGAEKERFLESQQEAKKAFQVHIDRLQTKSPLITADLLMKEGFKPGKTLGLILKKAEELVINNNLTDLENAMKELKKTSIWKENAIH